MSALQKTLPVVTSIGNKNTLANHLDTLLTLATAQDKNLTKINTAYSGLIAALIKGAQGKEDISKGQLDCIKIVLAEHKHLGKEVADIEELIKKVRAVQAQDEAIESGEKTTRPPKPKLSVAQLLAMDEDL